MKEIKMSNQNVFYHHLKSIIVYVLSFLVVILAILGLFDLIPIELTNSIMIPMLGVITLMNGFKSYEKNKKEGIITLLCGIFIFICCILVFLHKLSVF